ncbi:hypothetical protein [uncultured Amphritea sp.]|uniref:hypothetical protein n=1 Tax=uncultured Amphritea sp. TaxID=981605 RepID=UPI0026215DAD|nr:hypothetical protein [uncultured Amphritea sp.]
MNKSDITVNNLREACARLGYAFFERGEYNLNIIGIRSEDRNSNAFNDVLAVAFRQSGRWVLLTFDYTTDPGLHYRHNPANPAGTAVLVPGQYRGAFMLGLHQGKYGALTQAKALPVYRDNDLDSEVDVQGTIDYGWHGINIHRANEQRKSAQVNEWSAGCQVVADPHEFDALYSFSEVAQGLYGKRFTYTLLEEKDFVSERSSG